MPAFANGTEIDDLALEVFARMQRDGDAAIDDPQDYLLRLANEVANEREKHAGRNPSRSPQGSRRIQSGRGRQSSPLELNAMRLHVESVLRGLPQCHREAFILHSNGGLNCAQIAHRQGVARQAVLQKLARTYARLRLRIAADERQR